MGLDQNFYMTRKERNHKNGLTIDYYDYFENGKKSGVTEILYLRKDYDMQEIISDIYEGCSYNCDYIVIDHKTYKKIIEKYLEVMKKQKDDDLRNKNYMTLKSLELIDILFDFRKYTLLYSECC